MSLDTPAVTPAAPPSPAGAPGTDLLDALTAVFRRVLELAEVPPDGNFFLLGGDSLVATRVLSAVARTYGVELTFEDFLADPTPAGLADRVATATTAATATATAVATAVR
ncbi:acyl carrier protein [Kitasatospora fiedleri]|uniref:acyl carrier protein n=1 Tax=Kitasatospora fiedleri TaxID=2991545 RepID=UPI00249A0E17|nr:acyl carrier protein [Kitasatospora fiedleri]